jgi:RHS repeat-associated protein
MIKADYQPFGEQLSVTGTPGNHTYNGNELDDEWGFDLYYYGARYMDPALGRFITPDPINDFLNPYSYVGNNPMNRIDPTGMMSLPAIIYSVIPAFMITDLNRMDPVESVKMRAEEAARHAEAEYIRGLMKEAAKEADEMAAATRDQITNDLADDKVARLEKMANDWDDIGEVLSGWAGMGDDEIHGALSVLDGAHAQVVPEWDDEGNLISTSLQLDKDSFLGSQYSRADKIGFLIHEAAHQVFYNRNPNYNSYSESFGISHHKDVYYNYSSELVAYGMQYSYLSYPSNIAGVCYHRYYAENYRRSMISTLSRLIREDPNYIDRGYWMFHWE